MRAIIVGAGITGLSAAIALKQSIPSIQISVFEIRPIPSTIGGAVNLTPNALRYLSSLNALHHLKIKACPVRTIDIISCRTGLQVSELSFDVPNSDSFQALRAKRADLLSALTETWTKDHDGEIIYDARLTSIEMTSTHVVRATFTISGTTVTKEADILIGCDGIHSAVRSLFIEPDRKQIYSGIATAYGIASIPEAGLPDLAFDTTAVFASRRGSLLMSWANPEKTDLYLAAVMQTQEVSSREGWKAKGGDQDAVRKEIFERFCTSGPLAGKFAKVLEILDDWYLYPVYKLPPKGIWKRENVMLLGDAAHAMPPQGESTGFAIEDAVLFARIMKEAHEHIERFDESAEQTGDIDAVFHRYERNRRNRIDEAFAEADMRWDLAKDKGWLASVLLDWLTPWFLWWTKSAREKNFRLDVRSFELLD